MSRWSKIDDMIDETVEIAEEIGDEYGEALLSLCTMIRKSEYLSKEIEEALIKELEAQHKFIKENYEWREEEIEIPARKEKQKWLEYIGDE